jgi:hypothetical protein
MIWKIFSTSYEVVVQMIEHYNKTSIAILRILRNYKKKEYESHLLRSKNNRINL